jgi:TRAP-type C4-dicarboxylate transport system permease small subunit
MITEAKPPGGGNWFAQNAEMLAIASVVVGLVLCAASMVIGVDNVKFTGDFRAPALAGEHVDLTPAMTKEVGYLWAPNWSVFSALVLPLIVLFGLLAFRQIEPTLERIAARGMVRTVSDLKLVSATELVGAWRRGDLAWTPV